MTAAHTQAADRLERAGRARRGRLKLFIGFAAGVGKTWRMLEEGHALQHRGIDVVGAFVETHGRAETAALVGDLELVPRRRVEFSGVAVEEMDLEAVLARNPAVAIVDEIPRTNAPRSRNKKRYHDVLELLSVGIDVIGALDIQQIESLNGLVQRTTGVHVRETVPDAFLEQADQVVNLDLPVEDLLDRLRAGKIYSPERIPWALEHSFRESCLATLRELSLREVARMLDRRATHQLSTATTAAQAPGRVMVCLSSNPPHAAALLWQGSRMAGRLNTDWYVAYVETPREATDRIDPETQRQLHANMEKARELGGEFVRLRSADPASALLDFARTHRVRDLIVGRGQEHGWRRLLRRSFLDRLLDEAQGLDVHVVSFDEEGSRA